MNVDKPCPGCNKLGHSVQEWVIEGGEEIQMYHCINDDCRVEEYRQ